MSPQSKLKLEYQNPTPICLLSYNNAIVTLMFRDQIKLKFKAGNGGNGRVAFGAYHIPTGGNGGDGGSVYLQGSLSMWDYSNLMTEHLYAAENGEHGGVKNMTGQNGKDLIVKVPLKTKVLNPDGKEILTIDSVDKPQLLLQGGRGGLGNWYFRKGGIHAAEVSTTGRPGEQLVAKLVLELQGEVVFIGLPNAGKSSTLNSLTNADAKVASYEFTTLSPQLGRMDSIVLMDLPGLIENTAQGKGLGTSFVKHTLAAKLVAHFVSLEASDPIANYELMRSELQKIGNGLDTKPEVIILTKTDTIASSEINDWVTKFNKYAKPVIAISNYDLEAIEQLRQFFITHTK